MPEERGIRVALIKRLEEITQSKIIVYFLGDRPIAPTQISDDAVRPLYDHIRAIHDFPSEKKRLTLFLYSRGGDVQIPWRIVTMFRAHSDEFHVMVPYKAYSAATMITLGSDKIWMSRKAELGPIDPSMTPIAQNPNPDKPSNVIFREIGTEDVSAYVRFIRERAGITDQDALAQLVKLLADDVTPVLLGKVERVYSHIRLVADKLLSLHQPLLEPEQISVIIEALTEKMYVHGHSIGRKEAIEIGLDIEPMNDETDDLAWQLYLEYENLLKLCGSGNPNDFFTDDGPDTYIEPDFHMGCIESEALCHTFSGTMEFRRIRKIPSQPNINVNLGINVPPGVDLQALPAVIQQQIQIAMQQATQFARQQVLDELRRQSPVEGINLSIKGGMWNKVDNAIQAP